MISQSLFDLGTPRWSTTRRSANRIVSKPCLPIRSCGVSMLAATDFVLGSAFISYIIEMLVVMRNVAVVPSR